MLQSIDVELLPKQHEFLCALEREVLFSGAFGAGKTRVLCVKLALRASVPGAVELLCRKHNVTLKRSTLRTLLKPDGDLPPVLPPGTYTHNRSEQRIELHQGGEILYMGLDDPDKIGSTPATGVAVDEAVELNKDDWTMLQGRIRVPITNLSPELVDCFGGSSLPNQLYGACNPGPPTHFLAERFGLVKGKAPQSGCRAIVTCTEDNFFLPDDYVAQLLSFQGVALQRYVKGLWVAAEGLVYPGLWKCFVPHMPAPEGVHVGGVDFGYRNPFCALAAAIYTDEDDRQVVYVWTERYEKEKPIEEHAAALKSWYEDGDVLWFCDPEDPEAIRDLRKRDVPAKKAHNSILYGIDAVNGLIAGGRLFISDRCVNLRQEGDVYCYNKDDEKEKPVDKFNHAMSALRYLCAGIKKRGMMELAA